MVTEFIGECLFEQEQGEKSPEEPLPDFASRFAAFDPV